MSGAFVGAVVVLCTLALIFVLFPLLRDAARTRTQSRRQVNAAIHRDRIRELDQDLENGTLSRTQYDAAIADLDRDLVQSGAIDSEEEQAGYLPRARRGVVIAAATVSAVAVPVLALSMYHSLGDERAFTQAGTPTTPDRQQQSGAPGQPQQHDPDEIEAMAQQLRDRLEQSPDDPTGWVLYGRTMIYLENLDEAENAFRRALDLGADDDPNLLAEYADILAATTGNLQGEPMEYLQRALEIDPENVRALWLAGTAAYNNADYEGARSYWEELLDVVPPNSQEAQAIQSNLRQLPDGEG
ncbi:MAG: c-type cytochrome biogenesis protein CcmI [Halorhodospira halophila]|uniref:c-type cytochrome biogenesis protein CcmI n=1 Tax=Halorhodospira halophila TaxID=1053 RepID=UPI0026EE9048|nr:c-type cytochrome biogenesis protein CcmI [Halorhodospira halophila]MCC3749984.1 c-type cytochrome biogenesis protein CcmI [Halorhodospira halophila]